MSLASMPSSTESDTTAGRALHSRRMGSGLVWSQIGRVFEIASSLAFSILVVRVLGPQEYGAYAVLWSIVGVGVLLASAGYSEGLTRFLPALRHATSGAATSLARRLLWERVIIGGCVALAVYAAGPWLEAWTRTPMPQIFLVLVAVLILVQGVWDLLVAFYTASLRLRAHAFIRLVSQGASLAAAGVGFALFGAQVWVPLAAILFGYWVSIVAYLASAGEMVGVPGPIPGMGRIRRFGATVWLTNLATFGLANQIDVLLIAALLSNSVEVGYYNVAAVFAARVYSIFSGWITVILPASSAAQAAGGERSLAGSFLVFMKINLAAIAPPFVFLLVWGDVIVEMLFGAAFVPAAALLKVFAAFNILSILVGANICHPLLYVAERQRALLGLRITAGMLNIALDVWLIPILGAAGAVIGTCLSNLLTHVVEFLLLRSVAQPGYPMALAAKVLTASVLAASPAWGLARFGWGGLAAGVVLFGVIFAFVIWRFRLFSTADYATLQVTLPRVAPYLSWLAEG